MKTVLLVIDPQNDFVDSKGSLYVKGSEDAIKNLANYIRECSKDNSSIDRIIISQDTHTKLNVGFSEFWRENPAVFTKITAEDLRQKKYVPVNLNVVVEDLAKHLEERGQVITIWPHHCMEDSWGCEFAEEVRAALGRWLYTRNGNNQDHFNLLVKGTGVHEAYSILDCDRSVYGTKPGFAEIIDTIIKDKVDVIEICGFCTDVCVKYSTQDLIAELINRFNKDEAVPRKLVFLPECSKAIGDDALANAEIEAMIESYNGLLSK